jgi:ATP-dependent DNA helicase RecG
MALPINIPDLFTGTVVEWERLEFKEGWNPEAVLHTLCAFANDLHNWGGGYLLVGVAENDGRPVLPPAGLQANQLDRIQKGILSIAHRIIPAYHPVVAVRGRRPPCARALGAGRAEPPVQSTCLARKG